MYRSLLVPLDGSPLSEQALPLALSIARESGAALHLVHVHVPHDTVYVEGMPVIDEQWRSLGREHERAYLEHLRARLTADTGIPMMIGNPDCKETVARTLAHYAREHGNDLIIMTTHGRSGLERLWLGSVTDTLVRWSIGPILLVRPRDGVPDAQPPRLERILIPLDGSALAEQIVEPAFALGHPMRATYTLLQIIDPVLFHGPVPYAAPVDLDPDRTRQRQDEAQAYLEDIAQRLRVAGARVKTRVLVAKQAALAILNAAQQDHSSLIAMATHGRGGITRMLLGSVADKVVRGATIPVLVFHPREDGDVPPAAG